MFERVLGAHLILHRSSHSENHLCQTPFGSKIAGCVPATLQRELFHRHFPGSF